jgi:hypothetical protein
VSRSEDQGNTYRPVTLVQPKLRSQCTRTALNPMCDTCINSHLVCEFDLICMRCKARRIKVSPHKPVAIAPTQLMPQCTRTIPNLMCASCDHLGLECDFGPPAPAKRRKKKTQLPSLAETLARIPSIPVPTGSIGELRADPQPIAAPSSGGLFSYEEHVRDQLLIRTLQAKDDYRWPRNSVRLTRRPGRDVGQAGEPF